MNEEVSPTCINDRTPISTIGTTIGKRESQTDGSFFTTVSSSASSLPPAVSFWRDLLAYFDQTKPIYAVGTATSMPYSTTKPKSADKVAVAAAAPGCGGIKQCTA